MRQTRSCKIKVHVTLKDLEKSRQTLYVAFQYFLSGKEAKNSGHASASAFLMSKFTVAAARGRFILETHFRLDRQPFDPFLLKLGRSVPRFGKTEFQRKVFVGAAVNAKLLRSFLRTRDSHRWTWRSYSSYVTMHDTETFSFSLLHTIAVHGIFIFIYYILYLYQCHVAHNM